MKKYEFTGETMGYRGHVVRRIRALKDFGFVKRGDLGGWIEFEWNLSHEGSCWVKYEAKVLENARVEEDALVAGRAVVCNEAKIFGRAKILDRARVCEEAKVYDNAEVSDNAYVCRMAIVCGNTNVQHDAIILR